VRERELLRACGANPYQRALLLIQMAPFQRDVNRQAAILDDAANQLLAAQQAEATLLAAMQPPATGSNPAATATIGSPFAPPQQPKLLQRGPWFVELTHFALTGKGLKQPVTFACYCKPTGAGIGLSINRTAMELPGTGERVAVGSRLQIEGLKINEAYVFALAGGWEVGVVVWFQDP